MTTGLLKYWLTLVVCSKRTAILHNKTVLFNLFLRPFLGLHTGSRSHSARVWPILNKFLLQTLLWRTQSLLMVRFLRHTGDREEFYPFSHASVEHSFSGPMLLRKILWVDDCSSRAITVSVAITVSLFFGSLRFSILFWTHPPQTGLLPYSIQFELIMNTAVLRPLLWRITTPHGPVRKQTGGRKDRCSCMSCPSGTLSRTNALMKILWADGCSSCAA